MFTKFFKGQESLVLNHAIHSICDAIFSAVTSIDVLDGLEQIRLCVGYRLEGKELDVLPRGAEAVALCEPIYEDFPGWQDSTVGIQEWDRLPIQAQHFLRRIEVVAGKPIAMVSTGPERDETILVQHPFEATN